MNLLIVWRKDGVESDLGQGPLGSGFEAEIQVFRGLESRCHKVATVTQKEASLGHSGRILVPKGEGFHRYRRHLKKCQI